MPERLITEADMRDKRVFTVSDAAAGLIRLENAGPGIKTGFKALDAFIKPGLRPGNLVIPLARTGVGKSVLIQNWAYNTRAVPSLFITLELTKEETWTRLRRIARFHNPALEEHQQQAQFPHLGIVDDNLIRGDAFDQIVEDYIEEFGQSPQIIYVDYLGYYAKGQPGQSNYEKMSNAVMNLKAKAKQHQAVLISPGQVSRGTKPGEPISEDSARDAGAIEETADFLFGVWRPWEVATIGTTSSGHVQSGLLTNILKSRHGNKGRIVPLGMSHHSLAIVGDVDDRAKRIRIDQENEAYNRGEEYDAVYQRQRAAALKTLAASQTLDEDNRPPWEKD